MTDSLPAVLRSRWAALPLVVLAAATTLLLLLSSQAGWGPFYLDSYGHFASVPHFTGAELSWDALVSLAREAPLPGAKRMVASATFVAEADLLGLSPAGARRVNLVLHGLVMVALFAVTRLLLLGLGRGALRADATALVAALVWGLDPFHADTVFYVIQRMTILSALFYLVALYGLLRAKGSKGSRRLAWLATVVVAFALGLGSKENIALLPVGALLVAWTLSARRESRSANPWWLVAAGAGAVVLVSVAVVLVSGMSPRALVDSILSPSGRAFTTWERLLTQGRVVVDQLGAFLVPFPERLCFVLEYKLSRGPLSPPVTALAWLGIFVGLAGAVRFRRKAPLVFLAVTWFFGNHVLESTIVPLELAFVHRSYLPTMFVFLPLVDWLAGRVPETKRARLATGAVLGVLIAAFSYGWTSRAQAWGDAEQFWTDAVEKAPGGARGWLNLGVVLDQEGREEEAFRVYAAGLERAVEPDPRQLAALQCNVGIVYMNRGELDEALRLMSAANRTVASTACMLMESKAQMLSGDLDAALDTLQEVLALNPTYPEAHYFRGVALFLSGRYPEARLALHEELRLYPGHPKALQYLEHVETASASE